MGISFQVLLFSFHSFYLTTATGVWEGKCDPKGQRALPPVLHSGLISSVIIGLLACALGQPIPAVLKLGYTELFDRCLAQCFP
jgi:hypothetical protein